MADSSLPITGAAYTTANWSNMVDPANLVSGVYGFVDNNYAALSSVQAANRAIYRAAGVAYIQGFRWADASPMTLLLGANGTAYSRIDRVVLRLDPTSGAIVTTVIVGTAGASPAPPATGIYDLPLGQVIIPPSATTVASNAFTDERFWLSAPVYPTSTAARLRGAPTGALAHIADVDRVAVRTAAGVWRGIVTPTRYGPGSIADGTYTTGVEAVICNLTVSSVAGDRYVNVRTHLCANPAPDATQFAIKLYINGTVMQRGLNDGPWLTVDLGWDGLLPGGSSLVVQLAAQRLTAFTSGSLIISPDTSYTQIYVTATPSL